MRVNSEMLATDLLLMNCPDKYNIMSATNIQFSVAVHMMAGLGFHEGQEVTSTNLASSVNAAPSFVRQILSKLSKHGLVVATQGKNGSCVLARDPSKITLLEIYRAIDPPAAFAIHSYPVQRGCQVSSNIKGCMMKVLSDGQHVFERSLAKRTVADVVSEIRGS